MPLVRRSSLAGFLVLLLLAVPMTGAVKAYVSGNQARPLSDVPRRPSLAFHQYLVDLGTIRPTAELAARYVYSNMGNETVTIQDVIPSCGCLKPQCKYKTVRPGETYDFLARIHTANEVPGPREFTLLVKYTDPEPREELLTFRVKLPENQVLIRPHALMFYQLNGSEATKEVVITDQRAKPLQSLKVETSTELVHAELGPRTLDDEGRPRQTVKITVAGKVPARRINTMVTITTDDPAYRTLTIPLMIQGPTPSLSQNGKSDSLIRIRTARQPGPVAPR